MVGCSFALTWRRHCPDLRRPRVERAARHSVPNAPSLARVKLSSNNPKKSEVFRPAEPPSATLSTAIRARAHRLSPKFSPGVPLHLNKLIAPRINIAANRRTPRRSCQHHQDAAIAAAVTAAVFAAVTTTNVRNASQTLRRYASISHGHVQYEFSPYATPLNRTRLFFSIM